MSVEALRGTGEKFWSFSGCHTAALGPSRISEKFSRFPKWFKLSLSSPRPQGPILEDLVLSYRQVTIELNSATDNPLIDVSSSRMVHGGNFQAKSITSSMEKVRQAGQSMGRILFTQCTELIDPTTSRGLVPNLVIAEPCKSFIFKGPDILIASLLSELGFLANPVASHVQTAQMGNQALNSLALTSARYALDSLDILSQLAAAHMVANCQALGLRVLESRF
ncbi:MAG: hypothetical protein Q9217_006505 [Psora testacea]